MFDLWAIVTESGFLSGGQLIFSALMVVTWVALWSQARKVRRLSAQLDHQQQRFHQELTMISQSAMGVGNRVKHLERQLRQQPNPFDQALVRAVSAATEKPPKATAQQASPVQTGADATGESSRSRAEQALSRWMQDSRHIA
ncbi:MAG: hypothetical protein ACX931_01290 [Saccharospirillum sp.]